MRQVDPHLRGLGHEDRHAGLEFRRLDRNRQSPAEAGLKPLFEAGHFLGVAVTGQHDLLLPFEQRVERVEELFLRAILAGEKLDVVDQERVERAVGLLELVDGVVLQRADHVADEALRVDVGDPCTRIAFAHGIGDRVHQMRLAEADAAVDEQRVVGLARVVRHLPRRRLAELV